MIVQFGADVERPDGGKLATVEGVILDGETRELLSLVARQVGLNGQDVIVPAGVIQASDDDATILAIGEADFAGLEPFASFRNLAPPPDAARITEDEVTDPNVPDVPPVGFTTGVESIAFTPIVEEIANVPGQGIPLDAHTRVYATDGDAGTLKQVWFDDETRRLTRIMVEKGVLFLSDRIADADLVRTITPATVTLAAAGEDLSAV